MKQFTITFRYKYGPGFKVILADSRLDAECQLWSQYPDAVILTVRENNPPLSTVTEVQA